MLRILRKKCVFKPWYHGVRSFMASIPEIRSNVYLQWMPEDIFLTLKFPGPLFSGLTQSPFLVKFPFALLVPCTTCNHLYHFQQLATSECQSNSPAFLFVCFFFLSISSNTFSLFLDVPIVGKLWLKYKCVFDCEVPRLPGSMNISKCIYLFVHLFIGWFCYC